VNLAWLPIAALTFSGIYAAISTLYRWTREDTQARKENGQ
jgi:hypothetical protein